jgi:hypothetical protein
LSLRPQRALAALAIAGALLASTVGNAFADNRNFTFINAATDGTIVAKLFVSTSDTADWEEDTLGKDVLNPGEQWDLSFSKWDGDAGKCLYDLKVVTSTGGEAVLYKADLCTLTTVRFTSP